MTLSNFAIIALVSVLTTLVYQGIRYLYRKETNEAAVDLLAKPLERGSCPICSFDRYGRMHGYLRDDEPTQPHDCPEAQGWSEERMKAQAEAIRKRKL